MGKKPDLRRVFLPAMLQRLAGLITEQGQAALDQSDIGLPPRTMAIFIHIAKYGPLSAADLAKAFDQPHQLVTQRIDILLDRAVITRTPDGDDQRRKLLKITSRGKAIAVLLQERLADAEQIYAELFDEIHCDLAAVTAEAIAALERKPLIDRGREYIERTRKTPTTKPRKPR